MIKNVGKIAKKKLIRNFDPERQQVYGLQEDNTRVKIFTVNCKLIKTLDMLLFLTGRFSICCPPSAWRSESTTGLLLYSSLYLDVCRHGSLKPSSFLLSTTPHCPPNTRGVNRREKFLYIPFSSSLFSLKKSL